MFSVADLEEKNPHHTHTALYLTSLAYSVPNAQT